MSNDWPATKSTAGRIVRGLFRSRNHIWENDRKIVGEHGLTWAQFVTLVALRSEPPPHRLSPTELYDAVQVSSGGLTKLIFGLNESGLLRRLQNKEDRRSRPVQLTQKGKRLVEQIVDQLVEINTESFKSALSEEEMEDLAALLIKLSLGLDRHAKFR